VPPPGETCRVDVERERSVAGEVLLRKGHIERDCLRRASIAILNGADIFSRIETRYECDKERWRRVDVDDDNTCNAAGLRSKP